MQQVGGGSEIAALLEQISKITVVGLMGLLVMALVKGWLLTVKHVHDVISGYEKLLAEIREDRDFWRALAQSTDDKLGRSLAATETATKVTEKAVRRS